MNSFRFFRSTLCFAKFNYIMFKFHFFCSPLPAFFFLCPFALLSLFHFSFSLSQLNLLSNPKPKNDIMYAILYMYTFQAVHLILCTIQHFIFLLKQKNHRENKRKTNNDIHEIYTKYFFNELILIDTLCEICE